MNSEARKRQEASHVDDWRNILFDDSHDLTVGAAGENDEPLDRGVRNLAATAYLVTICETLGIKIPEEADDFHFARAIYRRVKAVINVAAPIGNGLPGPGQATVVQQARAVVEQMVMDGDLEKLMLARERRRGMVRR